MQLEHIIVNAVGKVRKATLNGRSYLVAPLTMLVPGVLNGSEGPLLYKPEVVSARFQSWNGMPIVINHPVNDKGEGITARSPDVMNQAGVGFVYNSSYNDKLSAEGYFDEELCQNKDPRILVWLQSGTPFELSTGLMTKRQPAAEGATHNGVSYTGEVVEMLPDHLAVLPDSVGACSLKNGCGVIVNQAKGQVTLPLSVANAIGLTDNEQSHEQIRDSIAQQLRSRFTQSDPTAWIVDVFDDFFVFEQGGQLFKLGYTTADDGVVVSSSTPVSVVREVTFKIVVTSNQETEMKLTDVERNQLVDGIVTNCSCWKDGKDTLNKMTDDQLKSIANTQKQPGQETAPATTPAQTTNAPAATPAAPAAPEAPKPTGNEGQKVITEKEWNEVQNVVGQARMIVMNDRKMLADKLCAVVPELQRPVLHNAYMAMPNEELQKLVAQLPAPAAPSQQSYLGATGAPTTNSVDKGAILPLPEFNDYAAIVNSHKQTA